MVPLEKMDEAFEIILENKLKLFAQLKATEPIDQSVNSFVRGRGRGRVRGRGSLPSTVGGVEQENVDFCQMIENFVAYFVDTWFEGDFDLVLWNHAHTIGP